jgi:hypothetical protein
MKRVRSLVVLLLTSLLDWYSAGTLSAQTLASLRPTTVAPVHRIGTPPVHLWQIEVHVGGVAPTRPTGGTGVLPPSAQPVLLPLSVPTVTSFGPSWFFGSGAALIDEVNATKMLSKTSIAPLDHVLTNGAVAPRNGWAVGTRLSRTLRGHVAAEFAIDVAHSGLDLTHQAHSVRSRAVARHSKPSGAPSKN